MKRVKFDMSTLTDEQIEDILDQADEDDIIRQVRDRGLEDNFQEDCNCDFEDYLEEHRYKADALQIEALYKSADNFRNSGNITSALKIEDIIGEIR